MPRKREEQAQGLTGQVACCCDAAVFPSVSLSANHMHVHAAIMSARYARTAGRLGPLSSACETPLLGVCGRDEVCPYKVCSGRHPAMLILLQEAGHVSMLFASPTAGLVSMYGWLHHPEPVPSAAIVCVSFTRSNRLTVHPHAIPFPHPPFPKTNPKTIV